MGNFFSEIKDKFIDSWPINHNLNVANITVSVDGISRQTHEIKDELNFQLISRGVPSEIIKQSTEAIISELNGKRFDTFEDIGDFSINLINERYATNFSHEQPPLNADTPSSKLNKLFSIWATANVMFAQLSTHKSNIDISKKNVSKTAEYEAELSRACATPSVCKSTDRTAASTRHVVLPGNMYIDPEVEQQVLDIMQKNPIVRGAAQAASLDCSLLTIAKPRQAPGECRENFYRSNGESIISCDTLSGYQAGNLAHEITHSHDECYKEKKEAIFDPMLSETYAFASQAAAASYEISSGRPVPARDRDLVRHFESRSPMPKEIGDTMDNMHSILGAYARIYKKETLSVNQVDEKYGGAISAAQDRYHAMVAANNFSSPFKNFNKIYRFPQSERKDPNLNR